MPENDPSVRFVYLHAAPSLIREPLQNRPGHFMNAQLIDSQFHTLESRSGRCRWMRLWPPAGVVRVVKHRLQLGNRF
jgi:gluconate kinase